nr:uncharacterized protein LOC127328547 [Lolium perenne]
MVKKKNPTAAASSVSSGAAAKASSNPPKKNAPDAPPPAPVPPVHSSSTAGSNLGDGLASSVTKRDEKRARSLGLISSDEGNVILPDHPPMEIPMAPESLRDLPDDASEGRDSSAPVGFHTDENASPKDERDDPMNSEVDFTNPPPQANDISDTAGSMRDDDADHAASVDAAAEDARASPVKRPSGGFADEDDLFDLDEGFIEPPSKKAKSGAALPNLAASEASAPTAVPAAQISTASSLFKGKDIPSTAAAATPPSGKPVSLFLSQRKFS